MAFTIDINENLWSKEILDILLFDQTTKSNIIWATEDYEYLGKKYNSHCPIYKHLITAEKADIIKPRILKSTNKQNNRTKEKAEVFTPSWVCNTQNNLIDETWFVRKNVFNIEKDKSWITRTCKINFPNNKLKTWKHYVDEIRLEITCGEAPYIVSRYNAVTGEFINLKERIGLLDRKLRVVNENTTTEKDWLKWSEKAYKSVYGFEFQGDNLLLSRENLLISYCEYMIEKLNREPTEKELIKIANIISWNIWQMDGLTYTIPYQEKKEKYVQLSLFEDNSEDLNVYCKIKDWKNNKDILFSDLIK